MKRRLSYGQVAPALIGSFSKFSGSLSSAFPDAKLKALVELRTSQINGCAYCIDMHSEQARHLGEKQQRLDCLVVWREVAFFTPRERAALAWAEAVTLVSETHVPDAVFREVSKHFSKKEVVTLTVVIATMNMWNRISVGFRGAPARRKNRGKE
jgi:AhpD family alkylhydroperoxidase